MSVLKEYSEGNIYEPLHLLGLLAHERRIQLLAELPLPPLEKACVVDFGVGAWGIGCAFPALKAASVLHGIDISKRALELRAEFEPGDASEVVFTVRGATIAYDAKKQELIVNGHRAPAPLRDGKQRLTIFCDRTGLEVFASDGLAFVPMPFHPKADDFTLAVEAKGGSAKLNSLQVHELKSAWQTR